VIGTTVYLLVLGCTNMQEISMILRYDKETPGKFRFENHDKESPVQDLYIRKEAFLGGPDS
jgi:hypothetical protein